jgi:hypothetical protein
MNTFENRQLAIEKTLILEDLTSKLIKHLIGLDLYEKTKTLDNKSSSISLRSKIDLLTDCGKIDKQTYSNLLHIISIRNQFAHNFECNNFEDLPKFIDGVEKPLLKLCGEITDSKEENLKSGFLNMLYQTFQFLVNEFEGVTNDYQINSEKLKIFVSKSEQQMLDRLGITDNRNRAIVLHKIRAFIKEEDKDLINEKIASKIMNFLHENPNLK